MENINQLNELIIKNKTNELIRITEKLHEKKITQITDHIAQASNRLKLMLITDPSASDKTTFSKQLNLQLQMNDIQPITLSMNNFYVNRKNTPQNNQNNYDFECIDTINLQLFNEVLTELLRKNQILNPHFDFTNKRQQPHNVWIPIHLEPDQMLIIKNIHDLNDRLTQTIPTKHKFKMYVSTLTQLYIDNHNHIFTSDSHFLHHIVRDHHYRDYSTTQTITN